MSKKMLIDAAHAEETRVVVLNGNRIEEFDFESRARKQLRGNIYLAKVTRVEPSLQAAFVEYGGNRHGFLAFNEIHPDYYQIPHEDREALMREADAEGDTEDEIHPADASDHDEGSDAVGGDDDDEMDEEVARRRRRLMRRYKIQEVIKRRQIMLVQVVKEERGNKGAALTTYMSLAGRYCVLMPNTDRGGGISRKITTVTDRKRLRGVVNELDVPQGMGLIVRTAGAKRTKAEIKRDYEYLSRAWSNIRDTTLHSIAPALIYEEEDLVKRAIRDLYDKDLEGIWVEGEAGFREARDFMRMLMPSQAKKIQLYRGGPPLFVEHRIEDHLAQIYSPTVPLKSGGYLVINQTEALVAIDVNSGRATRERSIESTALKTNLEAAEEAARQLRLRDLAGLIVIDFIDMDESKNNRAVEKVLKDCLGLDRARIQMGRISSFGLMEISRQRRRTGILEGTTHVCPHCAGAGRVRSVESSALAALRAVEMEALSGGGEITVRVPRDVSLYILNHKREYLTGLLRTHGLFVSVVIDEALAHAEHQIDRISNVPHVVDRTWETKATADLDVDDGYDDAAFEDEDDEDEDEEIEAPDAKPGRSSAIDEDDLDETEAEADDDTVGQDETSRRGGSDEAADDSGRKRSRRRRRGRKGDDVRPQASPMSPEDVAAPVRDAEGDADAAGKRRRRGRRGGRRVRDEGVISDVYAWSWPARLSGDDPYEWRGPVEKTPVVEDELRPSAAMPVEVQTPVTDQHQPSAVAEIAVPAIEPQVPDDALAEDMWVELPAVTVAVDKPARARRARGRKPAAEAVSPIEPVSATPVVDMIDPQPETIPTIAEAEIEPVAPTATVVLQPVTAAEAAGPDLAEITAAPTAPKRGWWRRG